MNVKKNNNFSDKNTDEEKDILQCIRDLLIKASKRQRIVATFFLENLENAVFMSIPQLADTIGVSTSTVARFPLLLGFKSFPSFQSELQEEVKQRLRPPNRLIRTVPTNVEKLNNRMSLYCAQHIGNIQKTYEGINPDDFERAIELIIGSRWIWIVGMRGSFALAHEFNFRLRQILRKSSLLSLGPCDYLDSVVMIQPEDLVIGFSFTRFTRYTVDIVRAGKERGAKTLTFTDRIVSPLTPFSDLNFVVHVKDLIYSNSYVAAFGLISCLLSELSTKTKDQSVRNLKDLDAQLLKKDIFYFG